MCNVKHKIALKLICEFFKETEHTCNLQNDHTFKTYKLKPARYGLKHCHITGPKVWSLVPSNIKKSDNTRNI